MERLSCPYCEYQYNEGSHLLISLECGHTICKSCTNELKLYFVTCPFDNKKVNFKEPKINDSALKLIKSFCNVHYLPIIGYCTLHLHLLCDLCPTKVNSCKIIKGNLADLNNALENEYVSSNLAVLTLQDTINDLKLDELIDQLFIQFNNFNQIKDISNEICKFESDRDRKMEIICHTEENLRKSIKNAKFISKWIEDIFFKNLPLDDNLRNYFRKNADILMSEVKALRAYSNVLMYYANYVIHKSLSIYLTYIATFSQIYYEDWPFNCIAIGKCIALDEILHILNIELMIDGVLIYKAHDFELITDDNHLTYLLGLPTINLKQNTELYVQIEIQDTDRYMFYNPVQDNYVRANIFNETQESPIAYFAYLTH